MIAGRQISRLSQQGRVPDTWVWRPFGVHNGGSDPWTLSPVTLGDGATVSGSFIFNADTNTATSIDLTVSGGTIAASLAGTFTFQVPLVNFAGDPAAF
jgi:hypothetical protein